MWEINDCERETKEKLKRTFTAADIAMLTVLNVLIALNI
jgi:hypothetical protein